MSATLVPLSACRNARRICSSVCPFFATFVSSSFSSTGPRLPLLTQLARGSLFGFWVIGANPVVRTLPNSGQNVASFSLATTERFTDRSGTKQQRTEWHRVVAFGPLADTCQRFLSKGRQVYIEGRLTTRQYEAKDGSGKRYRTEIVARQLRLLGNRVNTPKTEASDDIPF